MRNTPTAIVVSAANLLLPAIITLSMTTASPAADTDGGLAMPPVLIGAGDAGHDADTGPAMPVVVTMPEAPPAVEPLTSAEQELVDWAYARFALVGLDLPDVEISFHEDTDSCRGAEGRYERSGSDARIRVCIPDQDSFAFQLKQRRTLVHELAHAWDDANLDDTDRAELLSVVDAESWYAPESDWDQRGVERFAETIVWGLYDQLRRPTRIDVPCDELHADFVRITGSTAPGPVEMVCDAVL
jgi:hypothetical protein